MSLPDLAEAAGAEGLSLLGALHEGGGTIALLGPDGPRWEAVFASSPEAGDGAPHPIDRWSRRVCSGLAGRVGARPVFPFDGPPWLPFLTWAVRSGRAFPSPLGMLVHERAGLWFSIRGALVLPGEHPLPEPAAHPCETCEGQPCRTACPVSAFGPAGYDTAACAGHLRGVGRGTCLAAGCAARHACPVGRAFAPLPVQAARHMAAFLDARGG